MKDQRRSIWSWAFYDWANSAFITTVAAGFFPIFFKHYWANPDNPTESTFYLGIANSVASIIVAALAPFLGAIADRGSAKKRFLMLFAFLGIIMTGALWFVQAGLWQLAVAFYVAANIGFSGANIFYDSLLVSVASEKKTDFVSSLGYSLGYLGGGLLFAVNVFMYQRPEFFGIADGATAIRIAFITVAVWWAVFSLPILLFVHEPRIESGLPIARAVAAGWRQLIGTFRTLRRLKVVALFLVAYWLYIDGVDTIIRMAVDFGSALGFPASSLITALLIVQFVAFPAALLYCAFAKKVGVKKALYAAISAYTAITIFSFFMQQIWHFYVLAICVGLFQGGIQALSRSYYSRLIPETKAAEFYGFYNMLGKFAVFIGPLMIGTVAYFTDSNRYGILSVIVLFVFGFFLLTKVDEAEGRRMAREYMDRP
jgi:UMF1 family MFS transporter